MTLHEPNIYFAFDGTFARALRSGRDRISATMRARQMNNGNGNKIGDLGVPGPFGEIPKKLKEYYDSLQEENIPDRFLRLLEKLDQAERVHAAKDQPLMTEEPRS